MDIIVDIRGEEKLAVLKKVDNSERDFMSKSHLANLEHRHNLRKLYISVGVCILFMIGELVGGVISGSLAILTDAAHVFSDILGFCISIISLHITKRPASVKMSYGYHRAEVIGALLSITLIWGLTAWLLSEAIHRLIYPSEVDGLIMLITASGGLAGNIIMGLVLGHTHSHTHSHGHSHGHTHDHSGHLHEAGCSHDGSNVHIHEDTSEHEHKSSKSLNMRAAVIHVLGDAIQSVGVIIAGIVIYFKPEYAKADPICTLMFSVIVMFTTIPIIKDCIRVLMEGTPDEINPGELTAALEEVKNI